MVSLYRPIQIRTCGRIARRNAAKVLCSTEMAPPSQSTIKSRASGVVVDFSEPSTVYDNVKQAAAFGLGSIVYVPKIEPDTVAELSAFCEKASMGCLVAPTLSISSVLLQQAHFTRATLKLWNQDLSRRICLRKMLYSLQITYQISARYTTGKIWNLTIQQEARYSEKMEYVYTVWFFQALLLANQSTFRAKERFTPYDMMSQMLNA